DTGISMVKVDDALGRCIVAVIAEDQLEIIAGHLFKHRADPPPEGLYVRQLVMSGNDNRDQHHADRPWSACATSTMCPSRARTKPRPHPAARRRSVSESPISNDESRSMFHLRCAIRTRPGFGLRHSHVPFSCGQVKMSSIRAPARASS